MRFEDVDIKKTRDEVRRVMTLYNTLLVKLEASKTPRMTASYSINYGSGTNRKGSSLEDFTLKKIMLENKIEEVIQTIVDGLNKLDLDERRFLYYRYLDSTKYTDEQIMDKMHYSDKPFRNLKYAAYVKFAVFIDKVVYKN